MAVDEEEEEDPGDENIVFVSQKLLKELKEALAKGAKITKEQVEALRSPEAVPDEELVVPVDLRGIDKHLEDDPVDENLCIDVEAIIAKLGVKGAAEAFVEARRCFEANAAGGPADDDRPKDMTAKEWRAMIENGTSFDGSDLGDIEGEEEEELEPGSDLEWDAEEEAAAPEPAAKKAKKS
mmetsp:Transcript_89917/g.194486  ORF Transcript_89917/g.194486 Transcript_89917/m.194486 type:complete len:181 (+) Transcript_89917:51-593(+)